MDDQNQQTTEEVTDTPAPVEAPVEETPSEAVDAALVSHPAHSALRDFEEVVQEAYGDVAEAVSAAIEEARHGIATGVQDVEAFFTGIENALEDAYGNAKADVLPVLGRVRSLFD